MLGIVNSRQNLKLKHTKAASTKLLRLVIYKGRYTYDVHEYYPIFKTTPTPPHPTPSPTPCPATSKILPPLHLGRLISNEPLPSPNNNQSIKRKQSKDDFYMLSGPSFRSTFAFSINSLILSGFLLTSFHLAEANLVPRAI